MNPSEVNISILGDICPINRAEQAIATGDFGGFTDVAQLLAKQDLVVANLECPLTDSDNKIGKTGPNIKGSPLAIKLIKHLNISILALANNHILDYGETGLNDTIKLLNENELQHTGAGKTIKEARRALIREINGIRIGFLNVCEKEFNEANEKEAGANPFDLINLLTDIDDCRRACDFIILLYHGGIEMYNLPTPSMYRNFEFLAGRGVDVIVCNHQHVFSGYRKVKDSLVFYGIGNFIFDWPSARNKPWNYGLVLILTIKDKKLKEFNLVPFEQYGDHPGVRINQDISETKLKELDSINARLIYENLVREWKKFARERHNALLADLLVQNRITRYFLRNSGLINLIISDKHKKRLFDFFNCDSLSELARDTLRPAARD